MNPRDLLAKIGSVSVAVAALVVGVPQGVPANPVESVRETREAVGAANEPAVPAALAAKLVLTPAGELGAGLVGHGSHSSHSSHSSHYSHRSSSSGRGDSVSASSGPEVNPITRDTVWFTHSPGSGRAVREETPQVDSDDSAHTTKVSDLISRIQENDLGPIRHMLQADKWLVAVRDEQGKTPLHYAAQSSRPEIARMLLQHKAAINARGADGAMPIDLVPLTVGPANAASRSADKTFEVLLSSGANPNGGTKQPPVVRCLSSLVDAEASDSSIDQSATKEAAGVTQTMLELLKHGADIETYDSHGNTLLLAAISHNLPSLAIALTNSGANTKAVNEAGENALHIIARMGMPDPTALADLLLKKGLPINAEDKAGSTPLDAAIKSGNDEFADYLRSHGGKE